MKKSHSRMNSMFSRLIYKINILSCLIMCIWMILPFFRVRAGVPILMFFFMIWLFTTDLRWLVSKWSLDMFFLILFFITFVPYYLTGNLKYGDFGTNTILINFPLFFIGIFINYYYMYYRKDYVILGKIALITVFFFVIGSVQTYIGLTINPMASRILATGIGKYEVEKIMFNRIGVGGFGYIYASVFFLLSLLFFVFENNHKLRIQKKFIILITFGIVLLTILEASYAISLIIIFCGGILILVLKNKNMFVILLVIFGILLLLLLPTFVGEIFLYIANLFSDNNIISEKFIDLGLSFLRDSQSNQTSIRFHLYTTSMSTFLKQPLFGIYGPMGNLSDQIGSHSGWLDILGFYGLFTGIPLFLILYNNFKKHLRFFKTYKYYSYLVVIYFMFFVFGMINPILNVYEIGFVIFMIVPILPFISKDFGTKEAVLFLRGVDNENTLDN